MSNDPKEANVDLSKMTIGKNPVTTQSTTISTSPSMITLCNEGTNLVGGETSTQNRLMIGYGNFAKKETEKKNS